jgi:RHS repeat-associated protein
LHTYAYDARNRLASVDAGAAQYQFNGLSQRVGKSTAGNAKFEAYGEQGQVAGEYDAATALQEIVYLGSTPVAIVKSASVYYVDADQLSSPRIVRDVANQVVWRWDADAFGARAANEDPGSTGTSLVLNLRFPGQVFDREVDLHYNHFRTYAPTLGRFMQSDPIGLAGGLNTYVYVEGNPLSRIDPEGLDWFRSWSDRTTPYVVGREGNLIVPPGGLISKVIEHCVPAGRTFAEIHDPMVEALIAQGVSDWRANIPTMPAAYLEAVRRESFNSFQALERNFLNLMPRPSGL